VGAVYHLSGAAELFDDAHRTAKLIAIAEPLARLRSAILMTGPSQAFPEALRRRAAVVPLAPPTDQEYFQFVNAILADVRKRVPVSMELTPDQSSQLITHLRGLSFYEVRRVITQAIMRDGRLCQADIDFIFSQKREIVERSGVLGYFAAQGGLEEIAGLHRLKQWLHARAPVFQDPVAAAEFGLTPPRGLLLLGVQGCGKSLCAKAVAHAWSLPLLRLDSARIYSKYLGETERNLHKATALAERLAPLVLWIDELEKVFGSTRGEDSGASQRVLGSFLTWLQEKKASVFVIATSNDISSLPPELLRKGRFDEIFFVDLPNAESRADILAIHLKRRKRDPEAFDLEALAAAAEGFSGAELEQAVVGALYTAFAEGEELDDAHLQHEITRTRPLSTTMAEPIAQLRAWARTRTVPAD
jgi:MoxR-like ATPase